MALQNLIDLSLSKDIKKIGVSEERVEAVMDSLRSYISFWREYPDLFVDFMQKGDDPNKEVAFSLYFYQRVFLRIAMRFKYVYAVFPRACDFYAPFGRKNFRGQTSLIKGTPFFIYR